MLLTLPSSSAAIAARAAVASHRAADSVDSVDVSHIVSPTRSDYTGFKENKELEEKETRIKKSGKVEIEGWVVVRATQAQEMKNRDNECDGELVCAVSALTV
jgi:hypothetical protein